MLSTLRIKNLALAADLTWELQPGFNTITGETGAGKSILIGALNLVLGERADRTLIRSGAESCSVEAVFDISSLSLSHWLEENGIEPCENNQLVVRRSLTTGGLNRQFVNGSPTTLQVLAALGAGLVDIHGPHDHQSLLDKSRQLAILDAFGKLDSLREAFAAKVSHRASLEAGKAELITDEQTYAQQVDLLRYQVHEIHSARLRPDEQETLDQDYERASNASRLLELCQQAQALLSENEPSLLGQMGAVGRLLLDLKRLDSSVSGLTDIQEQALENLQELLNGLSSYADHIDLDPARLQELEDRINLIHALERKYGPTLKQVIEFGEQARQKLASLEQREVELHRLQKELLAVDQELWDMGLVLSEKRRKIIPSLCRAVTRQLADLGFKQSKFEIAIITLEREAASRAPLRWASHGLDEIEFLFAPNVGEPPRPLRAIASSGEMARVMLALKTVLAAEDQVPVLIFDEVDANVGGETARIVGEKMRQIGKQRQVLCITHLAPVAACASAHYQVVKQVQEGRTISRIFLLEKENRIAELSRMLGGQSETARKHAEALLKSHS